ncbi:MAG: TRAP transporter substrate-binding protein [Dehalococcoidia bacterium]|nr:MAG: TRAP transporter substrate-binding protein [Dehalococcoidia bacterium]UCG82608.1 MAG: TRAP transporter substrate-binding protein [Dehalococcoidia bacterium]
MIDRLIKLLIVVFVLALIPLTGGCGDEETAPPASGTSTPDVTQTPTPVTLKLVTSAVEGTPRGQVYNHFADLVEEYTDDRVLVDVYPGSQLFPTTEEWEAVVTGAVDIFGDSSYYVSTYVPDVMVFYLDGVWESYDQAYAALEDSELPQILADKVEEAGPVKMLGLLPGGMAGCVLTRDREAVLLTDLEGLRCQSSPGAPTAPIYDYAGMKDIPISLEEVSTAFIQGIVDAVQYPPTAITGMRLYETANHAICRTAWFFTTAMVMNGESWESLPSDIQDIIMNQVMPDTYEFAKVIYRDDEDTALALIEQNVDTMNWVTQEDFEAYVEYAQTHPVSKVQMIMIEPRILEIIEGLSTRNQ